MAEVLVTLGIIGIVAALTMPALIANYQLKSFETAFKKYYSVLNNTLDFLQLEEGIRDCYLTNVSCPTESNPNNTCYSSDASDCQSLKQGMINHLKLIPITNNFKYLKTDDVLAAGGVVVNKNLNYDAYMYGNAFLMPDGAVVLFSLSSKGYEATFVVVDVNGKQGPNKWGYDVFYLTLSLNKGKIRLTDEYASIAQKGGRLPRTILMNKDKNDKTTWTWQ